ncbi:Hypothetical predicted protein [Olea europaea subsp. europaea]|uniref:Uncharacterized protein n=1 Tax=Olea europaea subsp. europaea TaxID=158383 RepID=A0A8S0UA71_OLEEU|nr:Hypothetical predicted protein [Olea europaea subsp. europaea]
MLLLKLNHLRDNVTIGENSHESPDDLSIVHSFLPNLRFLNVATPAAVLSSESKHLRSGVITRENRRTMLNGYLLVCPNLSDGFQIGAVI